jgi:hypothetical protein
MPKTTTTPTKLWENLRDAMNALEAAGEGPSPYSTRSGDKAHEIYASGNASTARLEWDTNARTWVLHPSTTS